jgi:hypothetical protein
VIRQAGKQYAFVDKWELKSMKNDSILLPTKDGSPDWVYMTEYMENIRNKVNSVINSLEVIG